MCWKNIKVLRKGNGLWYTNESRTRVLCTKHPHPHFHPVPAAHSWVVARHQGGKGRRKEKRGRRKGGKKVRECLWEEPVMWGRAGQGRAAKSSTCHHLSAVVVTWSLWNADVTTKPPHPGGDGGAGKGEEERDRGWEEAEWWKRMKAGKVWKTIRKAGVDGGWKKIHKCQSDGGRKKVHLVIS